MVFTKKKIFRKIAYLLSIFIGAGLLLACSSSKETVSNVMIYYLKPLEAGIASWESDINVNATDVNTAVSQTLKALSKSPGIADSQPAISEPVTLLIFSVDEKAKTVNLDFAPEYEELGRTSEILRRAAIVRTLTQLKKIDTVTFTISGRGLRDHNGNEIGNMTSDMFIYNVGKEINTYDKYEVKLYFLDEEKQKLVPVYRSVVYKNGISIVKLAVEQIIEGPNTDSVNSTIPPDTKVNSVDIKDGVCYIDFSSEFLSEPLDVDPSLALYSVIDTVTEFPEVDSVVFSVDGESDFIFRDFEITGPYKRNTDYIK